MLQKKKRIYLDTSVLGGCFDHTFERSSLLLIERAAQGDVELLISNVVLEELTFAPLLVRKFLKSLPKHSCIMVPVSPAARFLGQRYLAEGVVPLRCAADALHVAVATAASADLVASWNFKHLANVDRVRGFNRVNIIEGFPIIDIRNPSEIVYEE